MRLQDDARKCVVYLGLESDDSFDAAGTGFFLMYDDFAYIVTAKHVADQFADAPFNIRVNGKSGGSQSVHLDGVSWHHHPDESVDLALVQLRAFGEDADWLSFPGEHLATKERLSSENIGPGDLIYAVGLFRELAGSRRNLPVVHTGHIAMLPDECVPVLDWDDPDAERNKSIKMVEAYLVEAHTLHGLSGAPVFVRSSIKTIPAEKSRAIPLAAGALSLLGMWQGAWKAPPDRILAHQTGRGFQVSVGMGVVVPANKIKEILDMPGAAQERLETRAREAAQRAAVTQTTLSSKAE